LDVHELIDNKSVLFSFVNYIPIRTWMRNTLVDQISACRTWMRNTLVDQISACRTWMRNTLVDQISAEI
jgi:hypothetical protein